MSFCTLSPHRRLTAIFVTGICLIPLSTLHAQEEEEPKSASDAEPKPTIISGVLEATESVEIMADTEQIESFEIKRIIDHGTEVRQGQNIVWFESEDIDKNIKEGEVALRLSRLAMADDEFAHRQFLETQALDKAVAERTRKNAQQEYDNFVQVDRERQQESAAYNLKVSQSSLENAMEELEQLEQMYKEDDLTEASEEIVLKRAKRSVEFAQYRLRGTEIQSERSLSQEIPRSEANQEDSLARAQIAYQKSIRELTSAQQKREIEMDKKRDKFKEQEEDLAQMRQERKKVVLASPITGILLHGKLNRGKLSEKPSQLKEGSKLTATQIVATVVNPNRLRIRVDLDQKHLSTVTVGTKCKVKTSAFPDFEVVGTVKSVSSVPYAGTKFDCVVTFPKGKKQPSLMPTMACELEFESSESDGDKEAGKTKKKGKK